MFHHLYPSSTLRQVAACFGLSLMALCASNEATAQTIYALTTSNELISFSAATPMITTAPKPITGVTAGMDIAGLDVRPATGELFALGYNNRSGQARLYKINWMTGVASAVGSGPVTLRSGMRKIGFDFNPTVDRVRVTGSSDASFRLNPNTGLTVAADGNLKFKSTDVNASRKPSIGTVAYTNSFIGASDTKLFAYDDSLNILATINPPNVGTLNTVGSSGIMVNLADMTSDLDIFFDPETETNMAYFVANTDTYTKDFLYHVNLSTGVATMGMQIGMSRGTKIDMGNGIKIKDIAIGIELDIPNEVTGGLAYALTGNNNLITFDTDQPKKVRSQVGMSGIMGGERVVGLDFRPATGELYALGYNAVMRMGRLYKVNRMTGVATAMSAAYSLPFGDGGVAMDFNPVVDRIRVVSVNRMNVRLNPNDGMLVAMDGQLNYAMSTMIPSIGAAAYTNSYRGTTSTTLYDYDVYYNLLSTQAPPNSGTLNVVGGSGLMLNPMDLTVDMDIFFNPEDSTNYAFLVANTAGNTLDNLYRINLATGEAIFKGKIGKGIAVRDLAIATDSITRSMGLKGGAPAQTNSMTLYPNPTQESANIKFEMPSTGHATIEVFNYRGAKVARLFDGKAIKGQQEVVWIAQEMPAGIYYVRLILNGEVKNVQRLQVK